MKVAQERRSPKRADKRAKLCLYICGKSDRQHQFRKELPAERHTV